MFDTISQPSIFDNPQKSTYLAFLFNPFQLDFIEDIVSSLQFFVYKREKYSKEMQEVLVNTYTKTSRTSL